MRTASAASTAPVAGRKALKHLAGRETPAAEQIKAPDLEVKNPVETVPMRVQNGRIAVNYVKPHFEVDKDARSVGLEISFELTDEHEALLSKRIAEAWDILKGGNIKRLDLLDVGFHYVELGLAPEGDDRDLELKAAPISKTSLAVIEEKGSGDAKEVIRLSFRVVADLDPEIEKFSCRHFGKQIWMKLEAVQGELL